MRKPVRFFAHGSVQVVEEDAESSQVSLTVVVPACVMQAVTPQLLDAGLVDEYSVREPLAVWVPTVADAGFKTSDPEVVSRANAKIRSAAVQAVQAFESVRDLLRFPGDALPLLPLGVYVSFRFRGSLDRLVARIPEMTGASGCAELKAALAAACASLLSSWGRVGPPAPEGSYPGSRRRRGLGPGRPSSS